MVIKTDFTLHPSLLCRVGIILSIQSKSIKINSKKNKKEMEARQSVAFIKLYHQRVQGREVEREAKTQGYYQFSIIGAACLDLLSYQVNSPSKINKLKKIRKLINFGHEKTLKTKNLLID